MKSVAEISEAGLNRAVPHMLAAIDAGDIRMAGRWAETAASYATLARCTRCEGLMRCGCVPTYMESR